MRIGETFKIDPEALEERPYARLLWWYLQILLRERQDRAVRAVEREELVYGMAHAHHDPAGLTRWRQEVRKGAGLLEKAESAIERAKRQAEKLKGAIWMRHDDPQAGGGRP